MGAATIRQRQPVADDDVKSKLSGSGKKRGEAGGAAAGTVVLLHPHLPLVGVLIVQERGRRHFNSTGMS